MITNYPNKMEIHPPDPKVLEILSKIVDINGKIAESLTNPMWIIDPGPSQIQAEELERILRNG